MKANKLLVLMLSVLVFIGVIVGTTSCNFGGGTDSDKECQHVWSEATCTDPKHCTVCGEVEGKELGHIGGNATCESPAICDRCHNSYGDESGHTWIEATCTEAKHCSVCGTAEGEALGHKGGTATCTDKAICQNCNQPYGDLIGHSWIDATCTEAKHCKNCSATEGEALGHKGGTPTCEGPAVCEVCDKPYGDAGTHKGGTATCIKGAVCSTCMQEYTDPLGHSWIDATCTEAKHCENCTATEGEPLKHSGGTATCTTLAVCDFCGESYGTTKEHDYSAKNTNASYIKDRGDCTTAPTYYYSCSVCGDKDLDSTFEGESALGHTWGEYETANGVHTRTCSVCHTPESGDCAYDAESGVGSPVSCLNPAVCSTCNHEYGVALGHDWNEGEVTTEPGCTVAGVKTFTCQSCGGTKTESVDPTGHSWGEFAVTTPATCTTAGVETATCNCGESKTQPIPATGHTAGAAATCETAQVCTVCGNEIAPATGHNHVLVNCDPATCTAPLVRYYECTCGDKYKEAVGTPTEHNIKGVTPTQKPVEGKTCEYVQYYKCNDCPAEVEGKTVTNHVKWTAAITAPATCVSEGIKTLTCEACGETKTEAIEADSSLGHAWNDGVTADGVITYTCTRCNDTKTVKVITSGDKVSGSDLDNELQVGEDTNFDLDAGVKDVIGDQEVTVSSDKIEGEDKEHLGLTKDQLAQIGNNPVYNFTIEGENGFISDFTGANGEKNYITITLPYELSEGEDVDSIAIWFINDSGEVEAIKATYNDGYVTFQTDHFSRYTVTRLTPKQRCELYGHSSSFTHVDPTCTEDGYTLEFCIRCGYSNKVTLDEDKAFGHDYVENIIPATCTEAGSATYTCSICTHSYTTVIPALNHNYVVDSTTDATCAAPGEIVYVCDREGCDASYTEAIAQLDHELAESVIAPTCSEGGYTTHYCVNDGCDYSYDDNYTAPIGHEYVAYLDWDGDKTPHGNPNNGKYGHVTVKLVCENCGDEKALTDDDIHLSDEIDLPTCNSKGGKRYIVRFTFNGKVHEYKVKDDAFFGDFRHEHGDGFNKFDDEMHWSECKCGDKKHESKHKFDKGVVTKVATCNEEGEITYSCECGYTKTETTPKTQHSFSNGWTSDENSHWKVCSICETVEAKAEHSFGEGKVTKAPTCAAEGEMAYRCACGYVKTELIPKTDEHKYNKKDIRYDEYTHWYECRNCHGKVEEAPHSDSDAVVIKPATCTEAGESKVECNCGFADIQIVLPLGHSFTEYNSNNDAQCGIDGTKTALCDNGCGNTDTVVDEGSALEHVYTNYISNGDATCTADGTKTAYCDSCGKETNTVTDEGSKIDHIFTNYVSNGDATCTADGTKTAVCDSCGKETDTVIDEGSTIDHFAYETEVTKPATCTEDGEMLVTCICGLKWTEVIPMAGGSHVYDKADVKYDETSHWYVCTACGEIVDIEEHTVAETVINNGTDCTEPSEKIELCSCGYVISTEIIPGGNHPLTEDVTVDLEALGVCGGGTFTYKSCQCGATKELTLEEAEKVFTECNMKYISGDDGENEDGSQWMIEEIACPECGLHINANATAIKLGCVINIKYVYDFSINGEAFAEDIQILMSEEYHNSKYDKIDLSDYCGGYINVERCEDCGKITYVGDLNPKCNVEEPDVVETVIDGITYYVMSATCPDCGLYFEMTSWTVYDNVCEYREYSRTVVKFGDEVIVDYTDGNYYDNHSYNREYELLGETCDDGVKYTNTCSNCGKITYGISYGHMSHEWVSIDLSEYSSCGGYVNGNYCEICGEIYDIYDFSVNCKIDDSSIEEVVIDGITYYVVDTECPDCGLVFSGKNWVEYESECEYTEYSKIVIKNGEEVIVSITDRKWNSNHNYEYTYEFNGETCDDGYTVHQYCTVCGDERHWTDYGHTTERNSIDLKEFGMCGGYIEVYECTICGKTTYAYDNSYSYCYWREFSDAALPSNTPLNMSMYQAITGNTLYLDGGVVDRFLTTTTDPSLAVDIYAEKVGHGYAFYYLLDDVKYYINMYYTEEGQIAMGYSTDSYVVYAYRDEINAWVTVFNGIECFLGSYDSYETVSACRVKYINAENTGVNEFPMQTYLVEVSEDNVYICSYCGAEKRVSSHTEWQSECEYVTTEYITYYINGAEIVSFDTRSYGSQHNFSYEYVLDGETCEDGYNVLGTCVHCGASTGHYSYNHIIESESKELVDCGIGCGGTHVIDKCIICDKICNEYTNENCVWTVGGLEIGDTVTSFGDAIYAGFMTQVNTGNVLYLDGGVSGRYLTTTTNPAEAVAIYAEAIDGGYVFYYVLDGNNYYITLAYDASGKIALSYSTYTYSVFCHYDDVNAWVTILDGTEYYIGSYNTYETISASRINYINAENTGVSQFPLEFAIFTPAEGEDVVCANCGTVKHVIKSTETNDSCNYADVTTYQYLVGGEVVHSYSVYSYREEHDFTYEYEMFGSTCNDGFIVITSCTKCDYHSEQHYFGHFTEYMSFETSCGSYLYGEKCRVCGEWTNVNGNLGNCDSSETVNDSYTEDGITYERMQFTCPKCGYSYTVLYWTESYDNCEHRESNRIIIKNGDEVILDYTESYYSVEHNYETTYEFFGNTCEDGYTVYTICTVCGDSSSYTNYGHNPTHESVDLSEYGIGCGGYAEYEVCQICNETVYAYVNTYCGWSHEGTNEDGYTVYKCYSCGTVRLDKATSGEKDENCQYQITYSYVYIVNDVEVFNYETFGYTSRHNYEESVTMFGESCEDGYTVVGTCTDCGTGYERTEYYHSNKLVFEVDFAANGCCSHHYFRYYECYCGQRNSRNWDSYNYSYDSASRIYSCSSCSATVRITDETENDGCNYVTTTKTALWIGDHEIEYFTNSESYVKHDITFTVTITDGVTVINGVCVNCGYTTNSDNGDSVDAELEYNENEGTYCYDFVFTPEESGYYLIYSMATWDTYVHLYMLDGEQYNLMQSDDDGGNNNNFRLEYYLEAGVTYVYRIRNYDKSNNYGSIPYVFTEGTGPNNCNHHYYNYYVLPEGVTNCNDGNLQIYCCERCGLIFDYTTIYHHASFVTETIDLSGHGACGDYAYIELYSCACGNDEHFNINYSCNVEGNWEYYTDDNGVYHEVYTESCSSCGLRVVRDYYYVSIGCERGHVYEYDIYVGDEHVLADYFAWSSHWFEHNNGTPTYTFDTEAENCESGVTLYYECLDCGAITEQHYNSHNTVLIERIELSEYGACGGYVECHSCPCGEYNMVGNSVSCMLSSTTSSYIDGNGVYHTVRTYTCGQCSFVMVEDSYTVRENCYRVSYIDFSCSVGGETLLTAEKANSNRTSDHNYQYEYIFDGESHNCEDGVTINVTCADCNYTNSYYRTYHDYNINSKDYYVSYYGSCSNSTYFRVSTCACGYSTYFRERIYNCSYTNEYDYITDENGVEHEIYTRVCSECGLSVIRDGYVISDGCKRTQYYTYTVSVGDTVVIDGFNYVSSRWDSHNYGTPTYTFDKEENCESGVTVHFTCLDCGYTRDDYRTYHTTDLFEKYNLADYGVCGGYINYYKCPCGYSSSVDYYLPGCSLYGNSEYYVDENGVTHEKYATICRECALLYSYDVYTATEGCQRVTHSSYSFTIGETDIFSVDNIITTRSTYHDYQYEIIFDNGADSCEDGVTVNVTCADCDYTNSYYRTSHDRVIDTYYYLGEHGACGINSYIRVRSCACGYSTYFSENIYNCSMSGSYEYYTDTNGVEHTVYTRVCSNCDLTIVRDSYTVADGCNRIQYCDYTVSVGEDVVIDSFHHVNSRSVSHTYGIPTYEFGTEAEDCESGVTYHYVCTVCDYTYDSYYNHHEPVRKEYYDLAEYGACYGYVEYLECACGEVASVNRNICYSSHTSNDYYDEDGVYHHVNAYSCNTCGLRFQDDYPSVRDSSTCIRTNNHNIYVSVGAVFVTEINYVTTSTEHDYVVSGELKDGATSCTDGVVITHTCRDCEYSYSNNYSSHQKFEVERYDMQSAEYGSALCEGYFYKSSCACGQYNEMNYDSLCHFGHYGISCWIDNTVTGWIYTAENYWGRYHLSQSATRITCSVTDPEQCGYTARYTTYWLFADDACRVDQYQTWQFGYDMETGTYAYEVTFKTGNSYTAHPYVESIIDEKWENGLTKEMGNRYDCPNCGSYYYHKNIYNENGEHIAYDQLFENKLNDGRRKLYQNYCEYENGNTVLQLYRYISADDVETWDKYEYSRNNNYVGPFGDSGYEYEEKYSNHNTPEGEYESIRQYAYVYYKGYDYYIYDYHFYSAYWEKYDYTYNLDGTCERTTHHTTSYGTDETNTELYHRGVHDVYEIYPTCTQDGYYDRVCGICESVIDDHIRENPYDHNWRFVREDYYVCTRCGLENINGASGDIVMQDLTAKYGNGENYVAGYWARNSVQFVYYISLWLYEPMEDGNDQIVLDGIEIFELTDVRALAFSKSAVIAAAEALGYSADQYDVSISFVPLGADGSYDYSVIFTNDKLYNISDSTSFDLSVPLYYCEEFIITPAVSGTWVMYTTNNSFDVFGELYDEWGNRIASNDDGGDGTNFYISYYLEAGKSYTLRVRPLSYGSDGFGTVQVHVTAPTAE